MPFAAHLRKPAWDLVLVETVSLEAALCLA
jgi:hypothetical protein